VIRLFGDDLSDTQKILPLVSVFVSFKDFVTMATLIGYLGFTRSFIHVPMPLVFAEYNAKKFPAAYGLGMVMAGIFGILAGPLVGTTIVVGKHILFSHFCLNLKTITWLLRKLLQMLYVKSCS
jgi:hypothetical protein